MRRAKLGVGTGGWRHEKRGGGEGQQQAGAVRASENGMGKAKETRHSGWTAPYK